MSRLVLKYGLAAAAFCALAACDPAQNVDPPAQTPDVEVAAASTAGDDAVRCMALLGLQEAAIAAGAAQGDAASLRAASVAYRRVAEQAYTAAELAQFFASSVAVEDDMAPELLTTEAANCVANAPASSEQG